MEKNNNFISEKDRLAIAGLRFTLENNLNRQMSKKDELAVAGLMYSLENNSNVQSESAHLMHIENVFSQLIPRKK